MRVKTLFSFSIIAILFEGCSAPEKEKVPVPDPRAISGEHREWWDVYSVEFLGDRKVRTRMGYLYRKWGPSDPKGKYWVRDLAQNDVGFLLPDFRAFTIVEPRPPMVERTAQAVSTTDLHGGIKRILQVPGTVELDKVLPRATEPSGPAAVSKS